MSSQRPPRPQPFIGERSTNSSMTMAIVPHKKVQTKALFATRFNPDIPVVQIEDYVKSSVPLLTSIKFTRLNTSYETYASYHVEVTEKDF